LDLKLRKTSEFKNKSVDETLKLLETSLKGLNESEVKNRLKIFGYNEISEKKKNPLSDFLLRYWGPMPWLLEIAMILSFALNHLLEGIIILVLLTINAIIGHVQSANAQKAVKILKKELAIKVNVLRDRKWITINAKEIVPGDIVALKLGDIVPGDAKIIVNELSVDESALTGESLPKEAQKSSIIYSGSVVKQGEARCVVINTGINTYFGRTTELVKIAKPKSHQEEIMMAIIKYMMYIGIGASILVSIYALILNFGILLILTFVIIFLIGAVPVALPAVLTIVQAVSAMELVKKGVLVTRLDSIEDAASMDILCLDKTGTITQNKLSVVDSALFSRLDENITQIAALASQKESMGTIDLAIIDYAKNKGVDFNKYKQILYMPFDPAIKRTEAIIEDRGKRFKVVKGATQVVMSLCHELDKETIINVNDAINGFSKKGYRTIAVAKSEEDNLDDLKLIGILALIDPPRSDSKTMIEKAKNFGIKPIMLTGDNIAIAKEIASQVGINGKIIRIEDIEGLKDYEELKIIEESGGFAEIYPEDKYKIVKFLQSQDHIVGMTGDGVNDAPALKQAEVGIAVSNSTDVAKASASLVLTKTGIGVIIDAVMISRKTYQRMLSWAINKVTKVIQVTGVLVIGFFLLNNILISLLGIALLIFANDFVTMSLATDNVEYTSNPDKWDVSKITLAAFFIGLMLVVEGIIAVFVGTNYFDLDYQKLQTFVLLLLVFTSQFQIYILRDRRFFWSSLPGKALLLSTSMTVILFILFGLYGIFIPSLTPDQILFVLVFSFIFTFGIDLPKNKIFKRFGLREE